MPSSEPPSEGQPFWGSRPAPPELLGASVSIGDDSTPDLSAAGRPPTAPTPAPTVPGPQAGDDIGDRLDGAEWIGRMHAEFRFDAAVGPGRPGAGLRLSLFRFEARAGDRVRFLVTPRDQHVTATSPPTVPRLWMRLYDACGARPADEQRHDAGAARDGQGLVGCKLKYTFNQTGPYHLGVWWHPADCVGPPGAPGGDPYRLWVQYEGLDLPDLVATAAYWDEPAGGLRLEYQVVDQPLRRPRPADWGPGVALYWVDLGCRRLGRVRAEAVDRHNADARLAPGARSLLVPLPAFSRPPTDATGVEFCLNADRLVPELDPLNNTRFASLPAGERRRRPAPRTK